MERDLLEVEYLIKDHERRDNIHTMSVLQRCHKLVSELKEYRSLKE